MENDLDNQDESGSRGIILGAVILAIIVAGAAWYFFIVREPADNSFTADEAVIEEAEPAEIAEGIAPFSDTLNNTQKEDVKAGRVNGTAAIDVSADAPTGPAEFSLAVAAAAILSGTFGFSRLKKKL